MVAPPSELAGIAQDPQRFGIRWMQGALHMEDVDLEQLARRVGTPTYVYSTAHITRRFRALQQALSGRATQICYAAKANSAQAILRLLASLGAGADIVSGGELQRVLAAGMAAENIVFSGVGKRDEEIDAALRAGVRSINVESEHELKRIEARAEVVGRDARVSLRINPDVDPSTHPYLATGLRESKFGIPMARAFELATFASSLQRVELVGLACHIGSQITEAEPFLASFARLRSLMEQLAGAGIELQQLDLGGGLGIAYRPEDPVLDPRTWGRALVDATADLPVELVIEPGRYLVGNAGILLTRVIGRKRNGDKTFVVVDAAMNDLLRPALYGAHHAIVPLRYPAEGTAEEVVDFVGPVCESGDFLARDRRTPPVQAGELVAVLSAGAYGMTMASTYNSRPLPTEVMVSGDKHSVIRPRKTILELLQDEQYPEWL